jgi:hypothetical protein
MSHSRRRPHLQQSLLIIVLLALTAAPGWAEEAERAAPTIDAVYVSPAPVVDGKLDDPCWKQAARLEGFICTDIPAPPEETIGYVCVDAQNLYFAFECRDRTPEDIVANETRRNGDFGRDDFIDIAIDPWHRHNSVYEFIITARGTQAESIPGGSATKIEWRGDWSAAAIRTDTGWQAEAAIPLAVLPYAPGQDTFGLAVGRGFAKESIMAFHPDMGKVTDLKLSDDLIGLRLPNNTPRPVVMSYSTFDSASLGGETAKAGVDVQYKLRNGLTALGSANPDFKQIEDVVEPVSFSYTERYLPDMRPFFVTGQDGFLPREHLLYTRRIEMFDAGVKLFGTVGNDTIGLLDALTTGEQNVLAGSWRRQFNDQDSAKLLLVSDRRSGDPEVVGHGGLAYGLDMTHRRATATGNDGLWGVFYFADSEESGKGAVYSAGGWHDQGSGKLHYDWMARLATDDFDPSLGYYPDTNNLGVSFGLGRWDRLEGGALESRSWNVGVGHYSFLDGSGTMDATVSPSYSWSWRNGRWLNLGGTYGQLYNYDSTDAAAAYGWNSKDLYRNGRVALTHGNRAGGRYSYLAFEQGFKPAEKLSLRIGTEYGTLVGSPEDDGRWFQSVLTTSYDLTSERSLGARLICRADGITGYAAYRQVVRHGLDIYVLVGDPSSDQTGFSPRVMVKLIRTL